MTHWTDRSPTLNKLAMVVAVLLLVFVSYGLLHLVTRATSLRHLAAELGAGRFHTSPIAERERLLWRPILDPKLGRPLAGVRLHVTPLWYDPEPVDVVCLTIGAAPALAYLVTTTKTGRVPHRDYRLWSFDSLCQSQAATQTEKP